MSCPDWPWLVRQRRAAGEDPPGWSAAVVHLAECEDCRRTAFALEPMLVFLQLPEPELSTDEGRRMVSVVRTLRRGSWRTGAGRRTVFLRIAAAFVLFAAAVVLVPERARQVTPASNLSPTAHGAGFSHVLSPQRSGTALLRLDSPTARVYEMQTPDMGVVMVVDDSLDLGAEQ